tara:strand:- start:3522 stop:3797 length:276 start_codon:yes stop_codon:yes gene_type:complete
MSKVTAKSILKDWLAHLIIVKQNVVKSHEFETDLVRYGEVYWGVRKLPSAYARVWRSIRESQDYKDIPLLQDVKKLETNNKEGVWELITNT